ncbi:hypothetical protein [Hubei virga-like virus 12]|uniref:hypothetical protein n=1 Tax=Hubei virga-like virus 12 TaxID=1923327 RepID=UPI00090A89F3|nr:hypothetical protein [Hubei virga-like virus 12]APG77686.1 hypothetical protein [Hubei virga-like virus 12]
MYILLFFILFYNFIFEPCGKTTKPTPALNDVCVFYCPSINGFQINKKLYLDGKGHSLHGFWYKELKDPVERISFNDFLQKKPKFKYIFYDSTTLLDELGCGQYREYVKHGAKSGYTYLQWLNKINECQVPTFPHQCHFNGSHNVILSISNYNISTIGCKLNYPFINLCRF